MKFAAARAHAFNDEGKAIQIPIIFEPKQATDALHFYGPPLLAIRLFDEVCKICISMNQVNEFYGVKETQLSQGASVRLDDEKT